MKIWLSWSNRKKGTFINGVNLFQGEGEKDFFTFIFFGNLEIFILKQDPTDQSDKRTYLSDPPIFDLI